MPYSYQFKALLLATDKQIKGKTYSCQSKHMHKNICLQPNHKPILKTTNQISRQSDTKLGVRNPTQTKLITKTKFYIACKTNKTKLSSRKKIKKMCLR
jgi:hypothetical protein